jgi:hypothetical protein
MIQTDILYANVLVHVPLGLIGRTSYNDRETVRDAASAKRQNKS